jgi:hypothetical protein
MRKLFVRVLTGTLIWSVSAGAQQRPNVEIVVEELNRWAAVCGIDKSSIKSIAALTLRNNGINGGASNSDPYLYIRTMVHAIHTLSNNVTACVVYAEVHLRSFAPAPATRFKVRGQKAVSTILCESGGIDSGPISSISRQLNDSLEQYVKLCLGQLDY